MASEVAKLEEEELVIPTKPATQVLPESMCTGCLTDLFFRVSAVISVGYHGGWQLWLRWCATRKSVRQIVSSRQVSPAFEHF